MSDCLLEKRPDGIAVITLNVPERMNAFDHAMGDLVAEHLVEVERDSAVRCVALTGAGKAFCAGGDVRGIKQRRDAEKSAPEGELAAMDERLRLLRLRQDATVLRLHTMAKPTVAIINGAAVGAGFSLALACDIRLMGDAARVCAGYARMALSGDMGGTYFLSKLVNTAVARELCFSAEMLDANRALALGLVNHVYAQGSLMSEAMAYCATLAAGPTAAFGRMKQNFNYAWTAGPKDAMDFEARNQVFGSLGRDHEEAVAAFLDKRPAIFKGF
jgi:2-(1,2-epoxy-1,2-dihydrophenyl)acetyl-CoA isomerase